MLQSADFIFKTLEVFWTQTQQLSRNHNKLKSVKKCDFWEILMPYLPQGLRPKFFLKNSIEKN